MKVKFCRGCGESLQVACLSCEEPIAVWDNFCTDCSGNQKELLIALREEMDAKRTSAETLGSELAFDKALEIAGQIADIQDTRLQHLKEWSGTFTEETTAEKERQRQHAADRDLEAIKHREAYDYRSAIQAIETIPEAMRTEDISARLKQLQSDHEESDELLSQIHARLKDKELEGLLVLVNRAMELRGDREDLQKLQVKLIDRENKLAWRKREMEARQKDVLSSVPAGASSDPQDTYVAESYGPEDSGYQDEWNSRDQTTAEHDEEKPPRAALTVIETIFFFFWDNLKVHGWMLLILAPVVAIPWVHFGIGGWYTFGTVSLIGLVLFGFAVADGLDEAIGVLTLPFLYWGAVWFVGWIFF